MLLDGRIEGFFKLFVVEREDIETIDITLYLIFLLTISFISFFFFFFFQSPDKGLNYTPSLSFFSFPLSLFMLSLLPFFPLLFSSYRFFTCTFLSFSLFGSPWNLFQLGQHPPHTTLTSIATKALKFKKLGKPRAWTAPFPVREVLAAGYEN